MIYFVPCFLHFCAFSWHFSFLKCPTHVVLSSVTKCKEAVKYFMEKI